jgi:hypothetical protein
MCSICLEDEVHDNLHKTTCNHVYHKNCIDRWLQTSNTCPYCRTFINSRKFVLISRGNLYFYFYESDTKEIFVKAIEKRDIELIKKHIQPKTYSVIDIIHSYHVNNDDIVDTILYINS